MAQTHQVQVKRALNGDCDIDQGIAWINFEVDDNNTLRLVVPEDHLARLKLAIQQLQGTSADKRRERGWPILETAYTTKVKQVEIGTDDQNQIVVIRTRFENGASQDTPLGKKQIRDTIEYLTRALEQFENQGKPKGH